MSTIQEQNANQQAKIAWTQSERMRQAAQNNPHISPGSVSGNGVFTTSQDFGSASVGDTYLDDVEQVQQYNPIEAEEIAALEEIEWRDGVTTAYHDARAGANDIAQKAAGMGINIKAINPSDPNQRYLKEQYDEYLGAMNTIGTSLQGGFQAQANVSDNVGLEDTQSVNVGGQRFQSASVAGRDNYDLHQNENLVKQQNLKLVEYQTKGQYNQGVKAYEQDVAAWEDQARAFEQKGMDKQAAAARMAGESLHKPQLSLAEQELALKRDDLKLKENEFDWSKKSRKDALASATDLTERLGTVSNNAQMEEVVGVDLNGNPVSKMEMTSHTFDNAPYGAKGHFITKMTLDPETKRPVSVTTRKQIDGKDDVMTVHEIGNDKDFLDVYTRSVNGNKTGAISSALANSNRAFDVNGNIITIDDVPLDNTIRTVEGDTKTSNDFSNIQTEYSRGDWLFLFGDEVMTKEILKAIDGLGGDAAYKTDLATRVGLNTKLINESDYKSFFVSPHHTNGKYVVLAKDLSGNTVVPKGKDGKDLYDKSEGLTSDELNSVLGTGHAPTKKGGKGTVQEMQTTIENLNRVGFGTRRVPDPVVNFETRSGDTNGGGGSSSQSTGKRTSFATFKK